MPIDDLSKSLVALDQDSTLVAVIELSLKTWLVAGLVPGFDRQPLKKLAPKPELLVGLLHRWRDEAVKAGRVIERIVVAFEAGRDGFWLARLLRARGIEAQVIHATSVAVPREHRRAKHALGPDPGERSARHANADAGLSGLAAGRSQALLDGGRADPGGGRRQASQPGT
jgi:hypothetical protein